jgi:hypothetical protein
VDTEDGQARRVTQRIQVNNGVGYGVIGGDIHVFGEHGIVYLLSAQPSDPGPGAEAYTGAEAELDDLRVWRSGGSRLAVRWLHASRRQLAADLAATFGTDSAGAGWQVLHVLHDPERFGAAQDHPPFRPTGDCAGILFLAAGVDQWPHSHVTWLLSNRLLSQAIRARVLLTAASDTRWSAIRGSLANFQAATSSQRLTGL